MTELYYTPGLESDRLKVKMRKLTEMRYAIQRERMLGASQAWADYQAALKAYLARVLSP